MRKDGNLVLYGAKGAIWGSRNGKEPGNRAVLEGNGNFAVYNRRGAAVWATGTGAWGAASLVVRDDGNVVLRGRGGVLWASHWHTRYGRTQNFNSGLDGHCTWYAFERFRAFTGGYPQINAPAHAWDEQARNSGWLVMTRPATQAVLVLERSAYSVYGHVAWVDATRPAPGGGVEVHVTEMNAPRRGVVTERWIRHEPGMSYILAPTL